MPASFLRPLVAATGSEAPALVNVRTGGTLATHVEVASDSSSRKRGLLGRAELPSGHALVIVPCPAIHTLFMQFTIDVVFAARDGRIVSLSREVRPWRIAYAFGAFAAIECPAGAIDRAALRVGDSLNVVPVAPGTHEPY